MKVARKHACVLVSLQDSKSFWDGSAVDWLGQGLSFSQDRSQYQSRTEQGRLKNQHTGVKPVFLMLYVVEIECTTTGKRKRYPEIQRNRITSQAVSSHGSASAERSLSTGPTAAPGSCWGKQSRASLSSSCTPGLAKFHAENSNQLSHGVIVYSLEVQLNGMHRGRTSNKKKVWLQTSLTLG